MVVILFVVARVTHSAKAYHEVLTLGGMREKERTFSCVLGMLSG